MDRLRFDWNPSKSETNKLKHGVSFDEACTAFEDPNAIVIDDVEHSEHEDRFILLDMSGLERILVMCHCYRESESIIRIISARHATTREELAYLKRFES